MAQEIEKFCHYFFFVVRHGTPLYYNFMIFLHRLTPALKVNGLNVRIFCMTKIYSKNSLDVFPHIVVKTGWYYVKTLIFFSFGIYAVNSVESLYWFLKIQLFFPTL